MSQELSQPRSIAVTSANSRVGRMLLPRLEEEGFHTIALVRSLIELPATQTISNWVASAEAMTAMQNADAIVHLSGEIFAKNAQAYQEANVQTTERVAEALCSGHAKRVVFFSYPDADLQSSNLFLKAKGQAEQLLLNSGREAIIFRAQAIINTPDDPGPFEANLITSDGKKVSILGNGEQKVEVVYSGDVIEAIVRALKGGRAGIYDLTSPDRLTLNDLVKLLNRNPHVPISHVPTWLARILGWLIPDLSPTAVDLFLRKYSKMNGGRAIKEFGLTMTSINTIWKA